MNGIIFPTARSGVLDFLTSKSGRAKADKSLATGVTTLSLTALAIIFGSPEKAHAWLCDTTCDGHYSSKDCAQSDTSCTKSCSGGTATLTCVS